MPKRKRTYTYVPRNTLNKIVHNSNYPNTSKNAKFENKYNFVTQLTLRLKHNGYIAPKYHHKNPSDANFVFAQLRHNHWLALLWYTMLFRLHDTTKGAMSLVYMTLYNDEEEYPVAVGHYCLWMIVMKQLYPGFVRGTKTFKRDMRKQGYIDTMKDKNMYLLQDDMIALRSFTGCNPLSFNNIRRIQHEEQFVISANYVKHIISAFSRAMASMNTKRSLTSLGSETMSYRYILNQWCHHDEKKNPENPFLNMENYKDFTNRRVSRYNILHTVHSLYTQLDPSKTQGGGKQYLKTTKNIGLYTQLFGVCYWEKLVKNVNEALRYFHRTLATSTTSATLAIPATSTTSAIPANTTPVHIHSIFKQATTHQVKQLKDYQAIDFVVENDSKNAPKLDGNDAYLRYRELVRDYFSDYGLVIKEKGRPHKGHIKCVEFGKYLLKCFKNKMTKQQIDGMPETITLRKQAIQEQIKSSMVLKTKHPKAFYGLQDLRRLAAHIDL